MAWRDIFFFLGLIGLVYFISHSAIGQRNPDEKWPQWVERIGKRDVPQVVRSDWFGWLAWLSRRLLPFVMGLTGVEIVNYLTGNEPLYYLNALDWVAILSVLLAVYVAGYAFAKRPRRGPLDKWVAFVFAGLYTVGGLAFAIVEVGMAIWRPAPDRVSVIGRMADWQQIHPLNETLGWAAGVIGLGVALLALIEAIPNWRVQRFGPAVVRGDAPAGSGSENDPGETGMAVPPARTKQAHTVKRKRKKRWGSSQRRK